jgi:predicted RNase H-related nuclease YkuK (DUF458 family)
MSRRQKKEVLFNYDEIREVIINSSESSAIYVGADSQRFRKGGVTYVAYVTAIILHIDSEHGGKLFKQLKIQRDYGQTRLRLMNEVYMASEAATEILDCVGARTFEIHLDINPDNKFKSNSVVKEATGYVLGMFGFTPKIKPESFAASTVSDRYTK